MKAATVKRVFAVMFAAVFGLILLGPTIGQAQGPADIPEMKLKFATFIAPAGTQAETIKWMLKEITRRTGGKVKFDEYWQEALLKDADLTAGCGAGTADMVAVRSTITVDKNPCWTTLDLPGQPENLWAAIWAVYEMTHNDPDIVAEFNKMNVVPTYAHNSNHQFLETKKPVRTLKDAKGMRVRTYGGAQATVLKHVGIVPVFVSLAEIYEGLSKGVIDGATSVYQFTGSFKYYEVAPYITRVKRLGGSLAATAFINKDRWNKFPPSLQKIINDVSAEYNDVYIKNLMEGDMAVEKRITTQNNVKIFDLDAASQAAFDEGIKKAQEEWFAKYDARGVNTRKVYERFQTTVKKYEKIYETKGYPWKFNK